MKKVLLSLASLFAAGTLSASEHHFKSVQVPFAFKVYNVTLPAGQYRVEPDFGGNIVSIVHLSTGKCVRVLRANVTRDPGRAKLIFEPTGEGMKLARVS